MKTITLNNGQLVQVDDADYPYLSTHKWSAAGYKERYAKSCFYYEQVYMHHVIMGKPPEGFQVHHKDGNTFNNQRSNLEFVTAQQNSCAAAIKPKRNGHSSGFKGVNWHKRRGAWNVSICCNRQQHFIGYFDDPVEAAKAYDKKAKELHGAFAKLNFP